MENLTGDWKAIEEGLLSLSPSCLMVSSWKPEGTEGKRGVQDEGWGPTHHQAVTARLVKSVQMTYVLELSPKSQVMMS